MAFNSREIAVPASTAWAAIIDPTTYEDWLVGAREIRDLDEGWPAPGARFHHRVGFGPVQVPDNTEVLAVEPGVMLRLKVRARPFLSAEATFRVVGDDERCVVTLQEVPAMGWLTPFVRPVMDPSIHLRNHRSLRNLARTLER